MRRRAVLTVTTVFSMLLGSLSIAVSPVFAAPCDTSTTSLQNGGFEVPPVSADTFTLFPQAQVPPWQTTDEEGEIEIWGTGFNGVPAAQGNAFAELNANTPGTLYQDIVTNPGDTLTWTLQHRGRGGDDSMQVLIGDALVANVGGTDGWNYTSADLVDGTTAWGTHSADYVVPAGQVCTRFAFRAVSTGSGSPSVGNFLDEVSFSVSSPAPTAAPGPTATPGGGTGAGNGTPPPTSTASTIDLKREAPSIVPFALVVLVGLGIGAWLTVRPIRRRR